MARIDDRTPTLWSLRPAGEHAVLREAAQAAGRRLRVLPMVRVRPRDAGLRLAAALACPLRSATSPSAVRAVAAQVAWPPAGLDLAVGAGTAAALARAGAHRVVAPERMDSEGLLGLPELAATEGPVGLLTAPGGRALIASTLRQRGFVVHEAEVYERRPMPGGARRLAAFAADLDGILLATSGEALARLARRLPAGGRDRRTIVVPGPRLAALAREAGFGEVRESGSPRPAALIAAACAAKP
ncbi:MAG: uroporphyrinogen-III synthase [Lysobacteraceae bacterium]